MRYLISVILVILLLVTPVLACHDGGGDKDGGGGRGGGVDTGPSIEASPSGEGSGGGPYLPETPNLVAPKRDKKCYSLFNTRFEMCVE